MYNPDLDAFSLRITGKRRKFIIHRNTWWEGVDVNLKYFLPIAVVLGQDMKGNF